MFLICMSVYTSVSAENNNNLTQTASGRGEEYVTDLSCGWRFGGRDSEAAIVSVMDYDDSSWDFVNIPHTWNVEDGADGNNQYDRTSYWYRKNVCMDKIPEEKRIYLEFLGANLQTDLYVNGSHIRLSGSDDYTHKGGYTAFRYDITDTIKQGDNLFAVRVDNTPSEEIAPISGDFNIYGGIYRHVYLVTVDEVHVDLSDNGSSGLFLTTPDIRSREEPEDFGTLNIRARIVNDGGEDRTVLVSAHIDGENAPEDIRRSFTIPAGDSVTFKETAFVAEPHLWKGIDYSGRTDNEDIGYRYTVTLEVSDGEQVIDTVSERVGFRYIYVDRKTGFYLNGESYPLHGVNRHEFKEGLGSTLSEADHQEDIDLIMELGANSVRLSHYPQSNAFYDLCDENGIIVWTEIPLVNDIGRDEFFMNVTRNQLTELIRQQYNRPSICFWGLENEIRNNTRSPYCTTKELLSALDDLAHEEDSSGRYTTQAVNTSQAMNSMDPFILDNSQNYGWKSDLIAWNIYPGWYDSFAGSYEETFNSILSQDNRPLALSEYGAGSSIQQHELYPELEKNGLRPTSHWHPEEYQSLMHEQAIRAIGDHKELWANYIWCMFDFDVDTRDEGSRAGQNDKGLVTNDRQVKKDSFYLYKANWNQKEPFVHITSSRFNERILVKTYIKVYSNCEDVELFVNGVSHGNMQNMGNGIFLVENVRLEIGDNSIRAVGRQGQNYYEDICSWSHEVRTLAALESEVLSINNTLRIIGLPDGLSLGELRSVLEGAENATYRVILGDTEIEKVDTIIKLNMTVSVTAENGLETKEYTFIPYNNLVKNSSIQVSSWEEGNEAEHAVDNDPDTFWIASDGSYPQMIITDLGEPFALKDIVIDWYTKNRRRYTYSIDISENGIDYTTVVEHHEYGKKSTTIDDLQLSYGRYVRITVLSCSDSGGWAGIGKIRIYGCTVSSRVYTIDYHNKLIIVPDYQGVSIDEFRSNLAATENCLLEIQSSVDEIDENTVVRLTCLDGSSYRFRVQSAGSARRLYKDYPIHKIWATSYEAGNSPENAADNLTDFCWIAYDDTYPQSITVDLGDVLELDELKVFWHEKHNRYYGYTVEISEDGNNYIQAAYCSDNKKPFLTSDDLKMAKGRYIRINVLSCSDPKGYAGIAEIKVRGWNTESQ